MIAACTGLSFVQRCRMMRSLAPTVPEKPETETSMSPRNALLLVVTSLALFGCATPLPPDVLKRSATPATCPDPTCDIDVYVAPAGGMCQIVVAPDFLLLEGPGKSSVIQWELKTSGFRFTDDGITILDAPPGEFKCSHGAHKVSCNNRHSIRKVYKYVVKVTGPCYTPPLDPYFMND